jgi:omega-amidase
MSSTRRIAAVSLDIVWKEKERNKLACEKAIKFAVDNSSDLVIFPETTLTGFVFDGGISEAEGASQSIIFFQELAVKKKIAIVFGLVLTDKRKKNFNAAVAISDKGEVMGVYKKIHPFSFAGEGDFVSGGRRLLSCVLRGISVSIAICYDLRFPRMFSKAAGVTEVFIIPSNWPGKRIGHWDVLLRARAIENQMFVLGVNRFGLDGKGLKYPKSTTLIDPWGKKVSPTLENRQIGVEIFDLDLEDVHLCRKSFPILVDRVPGFD